MRPAAIARATIAPVFAQPSLRAEQVTQLVFGETAQVLETGGEWRRLRTHLDGYEGWAHGGYLLEVDGAAADRWRRDAEGWSLGAVVSVAALRLRLPLRARVALANGVMRLPDGAAATLVEGEVAPAARAASAALEQSPERWALERFAGSPYQWGGVTPWGVDCSGLVQTTFAARGVLLPRDASQQVACGAQVPLDAVGPGDLLFFRGEDTPRITHVAFAAPSGGLVHSTVACGGVVAESWLPGTRAAPLRERLVAARRMEQR